jgi:hypothetical protein
MVSAERSVLNYARLDIALASVRARARSLARGFVRISTAELRTARARARERESHGRLSSFREAISRGEGP